MHISKAAPRIPLSSEQSLNSCRIESVWSADCKEGHRRRLAYRRTVRMIKRFLLTALFFGVIANAETISLSPIDDGKGTIGTLSGFMVVNGSITIGSSGNVDILLNYNYETPGAGG